MRDSGSGISIALSLSLPLSPSPAAIVAGCERARPGGERPFSEKNRRYTSSPLSEGSVRYLYHNEMEFIPYSMEVPYF